METIKTYKGLWMSPNIVVSRFESIVKKCGAKAAVRSSRFQREREAWITGVFILGLRQDTGLEYWVEVETIDSTPDTYGYFIEQINDNNYRRVLNFEVTEWEDHVDSLEEIIKNKTRKAYPNYFILLVYGWKPGATVNLEKEFVNLQKSSDIPFSEIWLVVATGPPKNYQLTKLYPSRGRIRFNLDNALEGNRKQPEFGKFLKRGTGTVRTPLGKIYFPLPECDN